MRTNQAGSLLLAVIGALIIISLAVFAKFVLQDMERKLGKQFEISAILGRSDSRIDQALANFVAQNKRLPCPANGTIASGALNAGVETLVVGTGLCNPANQRNGVVPWVTLGLSESDAADPWNGRITYRVQAALASNLLQLMNMSWCDSGSAATAAFGLTQACTPACTTGGAPPPACMNPRNYLYSKGLQVQDGAAAWLNQPSPAAVPPAAPDSTGAAYVLISHGPTGAGAYNSRGILQPGSIVVGTSEMPNRNNQPLTGATIFVDTAHNTSATAAHFDDYLSHPTISAVLTNASLAARTPH